MLVRWPSEFARYINKFTRKRNWLSEAMNFRRDRDIASCLVINIKANGKDLKLLEYSASRTTWTWGCSSKTARRVARLAVIYMQVVPTGSYVQIFTRRYYGRKKRKPKTKPRSTTRNWRPIKASLLWMLMNFLLVALGNLGNVLLLIHMGLVLPEYTQQTRCWIKISCLDLYITSTTGVLKLDWHKIQIQIFVF